MKDFLINNIVPIITAGIAGTLVKLIYPIGDAVIQLINKKKEQTEQAINASGHEEDVKTGWETWNGIDEKWRITDKVETLLTSKGDEFINIMKKKIPGLTDDEIISIRQAIAGEVNKGKVSVLSQTDVINQQQDTINKLTVENANLKDQASKVQSLFTATNTQASGDNQVSTGSTDNSSPTALVMDNQANTATVQQPTQA